MPSIATKSLSSADILSLFSSPAVVVPAPGAGKAIDIIEMWVTYIYGTVPYASLGNPNCGFIIEGGSMDQNLTDFGDIMIQTAGGHGFGLSAQESVTYNPSSAVNNKAILFTLSNLDFTDGDGTAVVGCTYRTVDLATGLMVP